MASRVLFKALYPRTVLATATFFAADVAAQALTASNGSGLGSLHSDWDPVRSIKTAAFGLGIVSWYGFASAFILTKAFPVSGKINFATAMLQAAAQQALFAPPLTFSFLYTSAAMIHDDPAAFETAKAQMPGVASTAWSFLPWVNGLAAWAIAAPGLRMLALNGIGFGWATYLATVATPGQHVAIIVPTTFLNQQPTTNNQQPTTNNLASSMASRILFQALYPRTALATATFFAADIASQAIVTSTESGLEALATGWDPVRSVKTAAFGLGIVSWYGFSSSFILTKIIPSGPGRIGFATAMLQAAAQQALFAPPLTFSFLYTSAALIHNDENAFETAKEQMPDVASTAWSFLPWVNGLATWGIASPVVRLLALNGIACGWATYLATIATPGAVVDVAVF
ncbi:hypothetical protein HDU78_011053 [Chytriomyces hyalinus]|nr:hypothetical protein HDU78_011053 [Chytriomyces hyalinus]